MKYERSERFRSDYKNLSEEQREMFKAAARRFREGAESAKRGEVAPWEGSLRVRTVTGHPSIWEMTWSYRRPDGRATWEWVEIDGDTGVRWRRVGTHSIFAAP